MKAVQTSGRRKTAVARATLIAGNGVIRVNSQLLNNMSSELYRMRMQEPLIIAGDIVKTVNINILVQGGGVASQADATRLAIARALSIVDKNLQKEFLNYDRTLLVADVRSKETHKPNCHGKARAKRQKSYR